MGARVAASLAPILVIVAACSRPPPPAGEAPELVVLAASSLTESLSAVAGRWEAEGHGGLTLSFDASSRLAQQIEAGAPADLYLSADAVWMGWLDERGRIDPATRVELLGNRLVVITPVSSPLSLGAARDLTRPEIRRLALAGEGVPAGRYARASLSGPGLLEALESRVISGDNVRSVLGWVAGAEADAGVVYATDAAVEPRVKVAFTLPDDSHPPIVYPAAVIRGSAHPAEAAAFLDFCRSAEATAIFAAAGFTPLAAR